MNNRIVYKLVNNITNPSSQDNCNYISLAVFIFSNSYYKQRGGNWHLKKSVQTVRRYLQLTHRTLQWVCRSDSGVCVYYNSYLTVLLLLLLFLFKFLYKYYIFIYMFCMYVSVNSIQLNTIQILIIVIVIVTVTVSILNKCNKK